MRHGSEPQIGWLGHLVILLTFMAWISAVRIAVADTAIHEPSHTTQLR